MRWEYRRDYPAGVQPRAARSKNLGIFEDMIYFGAPDGFLVATSDDAPETASERKFSAAATSVARLGGPIIGLRSALRDRVRRSHWRRAVTPARAGPGD